MTGEVVHLPRTALTAPFTLERPFERLGRALGFYLYLLGIANHRGLVSRNAERITRPLAIADADIVRWLGRLDTEGLVEVKSRPPFLVARLTAWSGSGPALHENTGIPSARSASVEEPRYSNSLSSNLETATEAIAIADGGVGEGGEALLREILDTLGETDADAFRRVVGVYPAETILDVLDRVRRVPTERVRKSKTALFRYLLSKRS